MEEFLRCVIIIVFFGLCLRSFEGSGIFFLIFVFFEFIESFFDFFKVFVIIL